MRRSVKLGIVSAASIAAVALAGGSAFAAGPTSTAGNTVSITVASTVTVTSSAPTVWQFAGNWLPGSTVGNQIVSPQLTGDTAVTAGTNDGAGFELTAAVNGPLTSGANTIGQAQELLTWYNPADGGSNQGWHIGNGCPRRWTSADASTQAGQCSRLTCRSCSRRPSCLAATAARRSRSQRPATSRTTQSGPVTAGPLCGSPSHPASP